MRVHPIFVKKDDPMKLAVLALPLARVGVAPAIAQDRPADPHSLELSIRDASILALQETLFDLLALRQAAHQAHWNVVGPDFHQAHEFYEDLYTSLDGPIDDFGARIRALGGAVDARPSSIAERVSHRFREPSEGHIKEIAMSLESGWAKFSADLYERMETVKDDMPTQDLIIGLASLIDKQRWMLRAHLK